MAEHEEDSWVVVYFTVERVGAGDQELLSMPMAHATYYGIFKREGGILGSCAVQWGREIIGRNSLGLNVQKRVTK